MAVLIGCVDNDINALVKCISTLEMLFHIVLQQSNCSVFCLGSRFKWTKLISSIIKIARIQVQSEIVLIISCSCV